MTHSAPLTATPAVPSAAAVAATANANAAAAATADAAAASPGTAAPDRYLVVGNPIAHSRSPEIHAAFAAQTGQHIRYERRLIDTEPADAFEAAMRHFFLEEGGKGANVTLPFKEAAFRLADVRSPRAGVAGAANTLSFVDGQIMADNTDGAGLVNDIQLRLGVSLAGLRVTVLGAGGAARGLMLPLLQAGVSQLVVANRTVARAQQLADDVNACLAAQPLAAAEATGATGTTDATGAMGAEAPAEKMPAGTAASAGVAGKEGVVAQQAPACRIEAVVLADAPAADVLINATSAGLHGDGPALNPALFAGCRLAYDCIYAKDPTPFLQQAAAAGVPQHSDGLGMLVGQAAESFRIWRGVMPDMAPVLAMLQGHAPG